MRNNIFFRVLLFILSFALQLLVISSVILRTVDNVSLLFYFLSMVLFYFAIPLGKDKISIREKFSRINIKIFLFAFLIICFALAIRIILMTNTYSFHNDEYISSYFSYSIGDISKLDWFGIYPIPHDWIWQFPLIYFFLQKVFFNIFGVGTIQMRLSILPYLTIIFVSLFLIVKRLYAKEAAYLSIAILAFFAPDLYLSRWSLHFFSSTAFFLLATYFFIVSVKTNRKFYFALFGFFLGTCYMTYYSSYLVVPLIFLYALALLIRKKIKRDTLINFFLAVGIFIYTISPLAVYAIKVDNFFIQRVEQVKIINGSWSPNKDIKIISKPALETLRKQIVSSVESLYIDGIGGHGGYKFGDFALFNRITFLFIIVSILYFLYKIVKKKDINSLFILITIFATFVTGMILTTPPPAFHRISLAFPFIVLIIAVTIIDIFKLIKKKRRKIAFSFLVLAILTVIISNIIQFNKILAKDGPDDPDYPQIQQYLEQQHQKMFYVAAFDSYGMGGILFIRSWGKINSITHQLDDILGIIPKGKTSFLVILYPDEDKIQKVKAVFPNSILINAYRTHTLLKIN